MEIPLNQKYTSGPHLQQLHQSVANVSSVSLNSDNCAKSNKFHVDNRNCSLKLSSSLAPSIGVFPVSRKVKMEQEITSLIHIENKQKLGILCSGLHESSIASTSKSQESGDRNIKSISSPPPTGVVTFCSESEKENLVCPRSNAFTKARSRMIMIAHEAMTMSDRSVEIDLNPQMRISPRRHSISSLPPLESVATDRRKDDFVNIESSNCYSTAFAAPTNPSSNLQPLDLHLEGSFNGYFHSLSSLNVFAPEALPAETQTVFNQPSSSNLYINKHLPKMVSRTKDTTEDAPPPPRPANMTKKYKDSWINEEWESKVTNHEEFDVSPILDFGSNEPNDETFMKGCSSHGPSSDGSPLIEGGALSQENMLSITHSSGSFECATTNSDSVFLIAHQAENSNNSSSIDLSSPSESHLCTKTNSREISQLITFDDNHVSLAEKSESFSKFVHLNRLGVQPKTPSSLEKKMQQLMRDEELSHHRPSFYRNLSRISMGHASLKKRNECKTRQKTITAEGAISDSSDDSKNVSLIRAKTPDGDKPIEASRAYRALQFEGDEMFSDFIPQQATQECIERQNCVSNFDPMPLKPLVSKPITASTLKPISPGKLPQPPSDDEFDFNALVMQKKPRRHNMLERNVTVPSIPVVSDEAIAPFSGRCQSTCHIRQLSFPDVFKSSEPFVFDINRKKKNNKSNLKMPLRSKEISGQCTDCSSLPEVRPHLQVEYVNNIKSAKKTYEDQSLKISLVAKTKWSEMIHAKAIYQEEMLEDSGRSLIIMCRDIFLYHCVDAFMKMIRRRNLDRLEWKRKRSKSKSKSSWISLFFKKYILDEDQEYFVEHKRQSSYKDDWRNTSCYSCGTIIKMCWFVPSVLLLFQHHENIHLNTLSKTQTVVEENVESFTHLTK